MEIENYKRLAAALDALPGTFPSTPSGAELRLLKKSFTEEEAEIGSYMSRRWETVDELIAKVHWPDKVVREVLESSLSKGLVIKRVVDGQPNYRLGHFLGIWYEALMARQMRNDVDFALLFEEYMKDGAGGKILSSRPGGSRVVPVRGSLKPELLQSYDDIDAHFNRYERFGVVDCVCQIERSLVGHNCSRTLKRCGFTGLPPQTPLSENVLDREAALKLFTQLEDEGLVHTGFYGSIKGSKTPQFIGCCNCCDDCCAVLRGINEWNATEAVEKSNYRAVLNIENCLACGDCVERCQVHAIKQNEEGIAEMDRDRCIGCGLCVIKCPGEAIELVPVSKVEWIDYPASFEEWEERRLINLGKVK